MSGHKRLEWLETDIDRIESLMSSTAPARAASINEAPEKWPEKGLAPSSAPVLLSNPYKSNTGSRVLK